MCRQSLPRFLVSVELRHYNVPFSVDAPFCSPNCKEEFGRQFLHCERREEIFTNGSFGEQGTERKRSIS